MAGRFGLRMARGKARVKQFTAAVAWGATLGYSAG
jgi:hypothetical protein